LGGFGVRLIVLEGGERLPVLVDRDAFPMFRPAVWMMTMRRAVNLATATLNEDLQALKVLYGWSLRTGQDIEDRMLAGEFLSATECASLVDAVRQPIGEMDIDPRPKARIEPIRTRNLESNRVRQKVGVAPIGTLGTVAEVQPDSVRVQWDGHDRTMAYQEDRREALDLAYAISIHKAQGSQFRRVVIPIFPSRLLDRTLVYTALTRAQEQVVLVGDWSALEAAVTAPPAPHRRLTGMAGTPGDVHF
jgi:hypothetical protein